MAAGKLCPQNRCPLFMHKGMQISPDAEWTLRTDPHGTHTLSQMRIECCTAMQLPSIKRKTSRTNDKAHPHICCWSVSVRTSVCESEHVPSARVIFCYDNKKSGRSLETTIGTKNCCTTRALNLKTPRELSMKHLLVTSSFFVSFFKYLSCFFTMAARRWHINISY